MTGGRYDRLLEQFGKDSPAVGFAIEVDRVLIALSRQQIEIPVQKPYGLILFDASAQTQAIGLARRTRRHSLPVVTSVKRDDASIEDYRKMAMDRQIPRILYLSGTGDMIEQMDLDSGRVCQIPCSQYRMEGLV